MDKETIKETPSAEEGAKERHEKRQARPKPEKTNKESLTPSDRKFKCRIHR